jgi:hypothetical protein
LEWSKRGCLSRKREREESEWVYGLCHHFFYLKWATRSNLEQRNEKKTVWMENFSCGKLIIDEKW